MTRDLRRYARQTNWRLLAGFIALLFIVGDGLIYVLYGAGAAVTGLLCLLAGLAPLLVIWLFLALLDWVARRANE
jgi:TM2 domain-containing membrane protein YozV